MTNEELIKLCDRMLDIDDPTDWKDRTYNRERILNETTEAVFAAPKLAGECLRLIAENKATRGK